MFRILKRVVLWPRSVKIFSMSLGAIAVFSIQSLAFDQGAPPPQPAPGGAQGAPPAPGGRGGGFRQPAPLNFEDHDGWTQIFDGQTMANWDCDPDFWSVVDGALIAKSTRERPAGTIYCPWTGGEPADFELKLEVKLTGNTNSGIQYRSARSAGRGGGAGRGQPGGAAGTAALPAAAQGGAAAATPGPAAVPAPEIAPCSMAQYAGAGRGGGGRGAGAPGQAGAAGQRGAGGQAAGAPGATAAPGAPGGGRGGTPNPRSVGGYQLDLHNTGSYPGQLYENGGNGQGGANRGIITYKGQIVQMIQGKRPQTIGCVGEAYALRGVWNPNDWNQIHLIARRGVLIHIVNGHVVTISLDEDPTIRKDKGLIAVQIEGNPVESDLTASFRNIWLRNW